MQNISTIQENAELSFQEDSGILVLLNLPDPILLLDRNLLIVAFNPSAAEDALLRHGLGLFPGMSILQTIQPAEHEHYHTLFEKVLKGERMRIERILKKSQGDETTYETNVLPAFDGSGLLAGILIHAVNVTERKRFNAAVHEAEERWQFAFEASNQAAWDWNMKTNEVVYSSSYKKMYGFAGDDLTNHFSEWQRRIHPDDRARLDEAIEEHSRSENPYHETTYRIQLKNGEYKWIMARGKLLERDVDGTPARMIGTHTDLTKTLETEAEIKTMNERFHFAAKATSQALWEWNALTGEAYVSPTFTEMFGWQADENSRFEQWHHFIHPEDRTRTVDDYYSTIKNPKSQTWQAEYRFLKSDGRYVSVNDKAYILRDASGVVTKVIGATQDISERKRLEAEILETELAYKKLMNQASVDSQEQERGLIGRELHDNVNQVLTTTKLYLELALAKGDMAEGLIKKSCDNIVAAIGEIRQLSRSLMDPTLDDLGLADAVKDLVADLNLASRFTVALSMDANMDALLDRKQKLTVYRIIQESLNNIVKHAEARSVSIRIGQSEREVQLRICDDGLGFTPQLVKKGAGLKNITNRVYLINGHLLIESGMGRGCNIIIKFPIDTP